jgi:hypothetical protein
MKQHLATLFGWRQPRHLPAQIMQVHATLLMNDGSLTSQIVEIPETTPLSEIIRAVAIQLFAEHNISGEVARIGEITLRASTSPHAHGIPDTMATQGRTLRSI